MNFSPFGGHFSTTIPTIHQFAAKFTHDTSANNALCNQETNSNRYTANGVPSFTQHHPATPSQQHMVNNKYQAANYLNQAVYSHQNVRQQDKRYDHQELAQELCAAMQNQPDKAGGDKGAKEEARGHQLTQQNAMPSTWQSLATPGSTVADYLSHLPASTLPLSLHHFLKYSAETIKKESSSAQQQLSVPNDINLLHANSNALSNTLASPPNGLLGAQSINTLGTLGNLNPAPAPPAAATTAKKKKKKKVEKEKKPRPKPGEIRLTTALDGSTLYCCPECHMAYPEKELLEQHLVGHTLERRFVCDICGAGLKRKDHLTRHKQSHNPERPYVCTVCLKAFKRKEQLTLHFVIHSGTHHHYSFKQK